MQSQKFLARKGSAVVGRIEALAFKSEQPVDASVAQFGSLDAMDNSETVAALLEAAEAFAQSFDHHLIQGAAPRLAGPARGIKSKGARNGSVYRRAHNPVLRAEKSTAPFQELRQRVDLIVVTAVWKREHLVKEGSEPMCLLRDADMPSLDLRGLRL